VGFVAVDVVLSPKFQLYEVAPELLLVVVKTFPFKHCAVVFSVKAAVGTAFTVTLLFDVSRHEFTVAMSLTAKFPVLAYVFEGDVAVEFVPSPNVQEYVMLPCETVLVFV